MTHEDNVASVKLTQAAIHEGALSHGESLIHMVGMVALSAKQHGRMVYFYADGKRVSRAEQLRIGAESLARAEEIRQRVAAAGISAINCDTAKLTEGFHTGGLLNVGTIGHRDPAVIVTTGRELPPGRYTGQLEPRIDGRFDVAVIDELRDYQQRDIDAVNKAFGMIGRCVMVDIPRSLGKLTRSEFKTVSVKPTPPRRNHGPRNRWGKLV